MAGTIRQRGDGKWELRVYLGRDSEGRVRHLQRTFHGVKRAAERELARLVAMQDIEPASIPEEQAREWGSITTINDAIAGWRENGWDDLSPKTVRGYESTWENHIRPSIGRRRIATLSTYDVEKYLRDLKTSGFNRDTVRHVRGLLHRACRLARKWSGNDLPNPVADAELPVWPLEERSTVRAPTPDEVQTLLKALRASQVDPRVATFVRLVVATGMRRGEACAVRWSDLDVYAGTLRVDESVVTGKGGASLKSPKTRASIRTMALDSGTVDRLGELRKVQDELARICDMNLADDAFIFSFEPGGAIPPYPDVMSRAFGKLRIAAGVATDIHLHSLRHFQATLLDPVISERQKQARMSWSTVHMARHYTDAISEEDRRAADHVGQFLEEAD